MQKIVLDTNILISGVIASGYSAAILDALRRNEISLVTSGHMLEEFIDVLARPRIVRKYPHAAENAEALLDFIRAFAIMVQGSPEANQISVDRDDDFVLACAEEAQADAIVSGDPHLLDLGFYKGIPILTPRDFVENYL